MDEVGVGEGWVGGRVAKCVALCWDELVGELLRKFGF